MDGEFAKVYRKQASKCHFDFTGIESLIVYDRSKNCPNAGVEDASHAWNIVRTDGSYSHLDVTFDLTVTSFGCMRYDYFNLIDSDASLDCDFDISELPVCNTQKNYYTLNGMLMLKLINFVNYLEKYLKRGEKDIVVKLHMVSDVNRAEKELMEIVQKILAKHCRSVSQFQISSNLGQRVFYLHVMQG